MVRDGVSYMLFNSLTFLIFLAVFMGLWRLVKDRTPLRLLLILVASTIFYGWWDWRFLFLIFFTGTVDFFLAQFMQMAYDSPQEGVRKVVPKLLVFLSVFSGIGVLSIFKYSTFFAGILSSALAGLGINIDLAAYIPEFCLILPVGISFYTFQSLSYTIDVYRQKLAPTRSWVHYMAYLMLFPQLVAGPIVRAVDLLPRLLTAPTVTAMIRYNALKLIVLGFFKKCVLADNAANIVDTAFTNTQIYTGSATWLLVMVMFSIQIYCDFSGYSDIARGIIKFMGYRFNQNFNHPYAACGMQDFWSRWHISLSSWFRDYVYIPLGGNRHGKLRTGFNLFFTFLVSGLWHGAAINYVIWGAYHGLLQCVEKIIGLPKYLKKHRPWYIVALIMLVTQLEVLVGWIFFRAETYAETRHIFKSLFSFARESTEFDPAVKPEPLIIVFLIMELFLICKLDRKLLHRFVIYRKLEPVLLGLLIVITIFYRGAGHGFIYFQF